MDIQFLGRWVGFQNSDIAMLKQSLLREKIGYGYTVRNIKPEIHRLDLMYEDLDFKYQHNLHDTLLGLKVPTVGFGNPKLSCVKIRSESKSNTLFTLTI